MRKAGVLQYIVGDHLGTTSLVLNANGTVHSEARHYPYGQERWRSGTLPTDYRFTGQRYDSYIKLTVMGARWYDGQLGRWISPDAIIPDPANPQSLNRYSYVYNRPLRYVDPSGHIPVWVLALGVVGVMGGGVGIGIGYDIVTTPAIIDQDLRATPPAVSGDVTPWLVDQMQINAQAEATHLMRSAWQSSDPIRRAGALKAWVALVRTNAIWDFKKDFRDAGLKGSDEILLAGQMVNFQAVANIHYGFAGQAAGFSDEILMTGAGIFHLWDNRGKSETWGTWETRFDQPFDNWWIGFGTFLYEQFGDGVSELVPETWEQLLQEYIDANGEPPLVTQ